ncbi:Cytidylate kinase [Martensiomyces pterosporus]|nr:Cytidylate kinase [Martensiomyces pterosporus]
MFTSKFRILASALRHTRFQPAREFTVAIDGPAASGKSSTARAVAQELGLGYIDSGSIYRCATLLALRESITDVEEHADNLAGLIKSTSSTAVPGVRVLLNDQDVSQEIRTADVNRFVAKVASDGKIRSAVLDIQRSLAAKAETKPQEAKGDGSESMPGGVVMDGRDIGTTIFPNAELKIYLDASAMARAIRRWDEMNSQPKERNKEKLEERDYADINRKHSPLRIAPDAVVIDNTNLTFEQQVYTISDLARERMGLKRKHDDFL